jgi:PAS domain S-box-containing protein
MHENAPRPAHPAGLVEYVSAVAFAGAVFILAGSAAVARNVAALDAGAWALLAALLCGFFFLQRRSLIQEWRGHRVTLALDEAIFFTALLTLPAPFVVPLVFVAMAAVQLAAHRRPLKVVFNVAAYAVAAGVGAAAFALSTFAGAPPLLGAGLAVPAYAFTSNVLVAGVFAILEQRPVGGVFRERFLHASLFNVALGIGLGIAFLALWAFHPATLLVLVPFGYFAQRYATLNVHGEREILVRDRLASLTRELTGTATTESVAVRVVDTCGDLFHAGRTVLRVEAAGLEPRTWSKDFEGGPVPGAGCLAAPLVGRGGATLGVLEVYPSQRTREAFGEVEAKLVGLVAAQTAAALEGATSFKALVDLIRRHKEFVENVPAGVAYVDTNGRFLHVNAALAATLRAPPAPGSSVFDLGPLRAEPDLLAAAGGLLEGKPFEDLEVPWGEGRWMSVSGVPHFEEGRRLKQGVLLFKDVTHRKEAEESLRTQSLTRPLVRRIVQSLTTGEKLPSFHVVDAGRGLAREVKGRDVDAYARAFRAMGLGDLRFDAMDKDAYVFSGDDLLERQSGAHQPTCHLARGFVEGAVAGLHGRALGSEVKCQSQGHPRCVFIVKPRAPNP